MAVNPDTIPAPLAPDVSALPAVGHKFVAFRREPRVQTLGLSDLSVQAKRSRVIRSAAQSERAAGLRALGLHEIEPEKQAPVAERGFQRLGKVGAFVVDAPSEQKAEEAKQVLGPAYHFMPNIQLSLPRPVLGGGRVPRGRRRRFWPADSGVAAAHRNGATGRGVLVGVLDTSCDADHVELIKKRVGFRYVPLNPDPGAMRAVRGFDVDGHGTHVCGIIAGRNVGVAPDVDLMVASVIESETMRTSLERILLGLDWMLSQFQVEENLDKPTIISMSLGFRPEWISAPELQSVMDGIRLLFTTLVNDFDILPVVAIGNDGPGTMRAPAYFPEALSVGALDFNLDPWSGSGGGLSPFTGDPKPDVAGYGVDVLSSLERDEDNTSWYGQMTGTSMATPYVTGIAALLASTDPRLQGDALRQRILDDALRLGAGPNRVGVGLARAV